MNQEVKKLITTIYAVNETYYKYGNSKLFTYNDYEIFINDITEKYKNYIEVCYDSDDSYDQRSSEKSKEIQSGTKDWYEKVVELGNKVVDDQSGWGITEIHIIEVYNDGSISKRIF